MAIMTNPAIKAIIIIATDENSMLAFLFPFKDILLNLRKIHQSPYYRKQPKTQYECQYYFYDERPLLLPFLIDYHD